MNPLKKTAVGLLLSLLVLLSGCSGVTLPPIVIPTPPPVVTPPTPPPPSPVCVEGQAFGCWHNPGQGWIFACEAPWLPGGVVSVAKPELCPTAPAPVSCASLTCPEPGDSPLKTVCQDTPNGPLCVMPTPPSPPAAGCSIDGEPGPALPSHKAALGLEVNAAMAALRPDCDPGGRCVLEDARQEWQAKVIAELRKRGICAGQHEPTTDEIAVATSVTAPREGWHVYAGPWAGPGTVVWSPQAARLSYAAPASAPPPPTSPPVGSCPAEPCPARVWTRETLPPGWGENEIGQATWEWRAGHESRLPDGTPAIDMTPAMRRDEPYCRSIGMSPRDNGTLRADCPMRPDGHPEREAVERWLLGGAPVPDGPGCDPEGRPAFAVPKLGHCRLCDASKTVCSGRW